MPPSAHFLLAFALAATLALPASAAVLGEGGCACSDVRPRVGSGATHVERFAVGKTCAEIRDAGDCSAEWMTDTVKELSGDGYCMITCGKCSCCAPVATTLRKAGLARLLDAAKGTPYEEAFADPAWMGAVLAPQATAGPITSQDIDSYILPPVPEWGNATWTVDLLSAERSVTTAGGRRLPVRGGGGVGGDQVGRAQVVQGDITACKAVVHVVDKAVV